MITITKEQAQKIIEASDDVITALAGKNEDVHPESDSMLRLWDDLNDRYAPPEVVRELARIALASLEAEAVAYTDAEELRFHHATSDMWPVPLGHGMDLPLYAAPPAPLTLPDEVIVFLNHLEDVLPDEAFNLIDVKTWNNVSMLSRPDVYRAAMLQGADGNSPVIPDGLRLALSNAGIAAPESDEMLAATCEKYIQELVTWVKDRKPFQTAAPDFREIVNSSTNNCRENAETSTKCWCRTCHPVTISDMRFVVCPECGNKRCPHANDHRNACTGSNEPGQEGSAYPAAPQQEVK